MKKNSKDSKQMLFEMMHKVGGLPVKEGNENHEYVCWDAGGGNYEIDEYDPNISWHNDSDVYRGSYDECLRHKEESEEDNYRFKNNMPHKSWGDNPPDYR